MGLYKRVEAVYMNGTSRVILKEDQNIQAMDYHYRWLQRGDSSICLYMLKNNS